MKMFDNIKSRVGEYVVTKAAEIMLLNDPRMRKYFLASSSFSTRESYRQCIWIYAAVNCIVRNIMTLPIKVREKKKNGKEMDKDNELVRFFNISKVMPIMTFQQFLEGYLINWLIRGEAFGYKQNGWGRGRLGELWLLPSDRLSEVVVYGDLQGWYYTSDKRRISIAVEDLIFERFYNPFDPIRGLNPVEVAKVAAEIDFNASWTSNIFFKNGAVMPGLIEVERRLGQVQFDRLKTQFDEMAGGKEHSWKPPILDGGAKWKDRKTESHGTVFDKTKSIAREEILAVYNVPPSEVGIFQYASYANADRQSYNFWNKNLYPKAITIQSMINANIVESYNPALEMYFDFSSIPELQEDIYKKALIAKSYFDMGIPITAINHRLGLGFDASDLPKPVPAAPAVPALPGHTPDSQPVNPQTSPPKPKPKPADNNVRELKDNSSIISVVEPELLPVDVYQRLMADTHKTEIWKHTQHRIENLMPPVAKLVSDIYYGMEMKIVDAVRLHYRTEYGLAVVDKIDFDTSPISDEIAAFFQRSYLKAFLEGSIEIRSSFTKGLGLQALTQYSESTLDQYASKTNDVHHVYGVRSLQHRINILKQIPRTVIKRAKSRLIISINEGKTMNAAVADIRKTVFLSETVAARSGSVANTESSIAANVGRHAEILRRNVDRSWICSRKENGREDHVREELEGNVLTPDQHYLITGLMHPCDPKGDASEIINCNCIEIPILP